MFHPVGSQPPSIYWRRRFVLLASLVALVVLIFLTVRVVLSHDPSHPTAASTGAPFSQSAPASTPAASPSSTKSSAQPTPTPTSSPPSGSKSKSSRSPSASTASSVAPKPCPTSSLKLAAVTDHPKYSVGDNPELSIEVTNKGTVSCVVDLADPQIVMRVYNGESRVWGSHDCKVEPGVDDRTLMAGTSVRVSIVWSGLSSQPKCAGSRPRVGAGTYTLYASLAGHEAAAAQFTIS
jgi:hypothetical protein